MALVPARDILEIATIAGYGVVTVAPGSLDLARVVLAAALEEQAPILIGALAQAPEDFLAQLRELCEQAQSPVALHCLGNNGGDPFALVEQGFGSLSISHVGPDRALNLEETTTAVSAAQEAGLWAEAGLGWDAMDHDPDAGAAFARNCGCNAIAVDPGGSPLDIDELYALANRLIAFPLAVADPEMASQGHGDGLENWIRRAAHMGVCRVDVTLQVEAAFDAGGEQGAKACIQEFMTTLGSKGRW
ncbi:MAG: hypothetical protein D6E12_02740 [Desulfovibrio sp.]|nr:MAG: hypothetical protein D6E12_02740 [Desulfovibrio sp.]